MVRLHLRRETADPVGARQGSCPDPQDVTARPWGRADPDQPDHARLDQLLQTCRCAHLQPPPAVHLVADLQMMRTRHRWRWKDVRRWLTDHTGRWRPITADGIEKPMPPQSRLLGTATAATRSPTPGPWPFKPTHGRTMSPLRGNTHGGFGERPGETDREQSRHRAPGRLNWW